MSFGERLVYLRGLHGISVEGLGAVLGIHRDVVCAYEKDRLSPSVELLILVSAYFEVSIDYLVGADRKEDTSSKIEEVLKDVLSEFDGLVSSSFIDENRKIFRNLVRNDLEILVKVKKILKK